MLDMEFQMNGAEVGDGTTEAQTNLKIALKLQNLLEQSRLYCYINSIR